MRTKTLLLTAALSAAGVAASMAQVYSVNVVGYVNVTIPAGKWACLANPLNNGANALNTIIPLPDTADGAFLYRFNPANQSWRDAIQFVGGLGWYNSDESDPDPIVAPGEGFFVQNITANPINITFVGEVPQGNLSQPIAGNGRFTLVGSQVPQKAKLGDTTINANGTLQFPAADGDLIYLWDPVSQGYKSAYVYTGGFGWYSPDDEENVAGPEVDVAAGFWVQKGTASPAATWARTFNVQ